MPFAPGPAGQLPDGWPRSGARWQEQLAEHLGDCGLDAGWLLVCRPAEGGARLVPIDTPDHLQRQQQLFGVDYRPVLRFPRLGQGGQDGSGPEKLGRTRRGGHWGGDPGPEQAESGQYLWR